MYGLRPHQPVEWHEKVSLFMRLPLTPYKCDIQVLRLFLYSERVHPRLRKSKTASALSPCSICHRVHEHPDKFSACLHRIHGGSSDGELIDLAPDKYAPIKRIDTKIIGISLDHHLSPWALAAKTCTSQPTWLCGQGPRVLQAGSNQNVRSPSSEVGTPDKDISHRTNS